MHRWDLTVHHYQISLEYSHICLDSELYHPLSQYAPSFRIQTCRWYRHLCPECFPGNWSFYLLRALSNTNTYILQWLRRRLSKDHSNCQFNPRWFILGSPNSSKELTYHRKRPMFLKWNTVWFQLLLWTLSYLPSHVKHWSMPSIDLWWIWLVARFYVKCFEDKTLFLSVSWSWAGRGELAFYFLCIGRWYRNWLHKQWVVGYPGGAILPVFDALHSCPHFQFALPRHEQGQVIWRRDMPAYPGSQELSDHIGAGRD